MVQLIDPERQQPITMWDTRFPASDGNVDGGDWSVSNGGLVADQALATAILLQLFTDRRAPDDIELPGGGDDRRGWWGDYVNVKSDQGEQEMGSLLWLYERSQLTDEIAERIRAEAESVLQTLVDQRAFGRITVTETHDVVKQWLILDIQAYSQDGERIYDQKFHRLWRQVYPEV